ncbi:allantoicase [soil metagenome]
MSDSFPLPDLAARRLGGRVLYANDEFFAPKENLNLEAEPVFDPARYTDRGKWMDGWETRRRREPGHDWCVVRLGVPGVIREVVVDTAHFRGNHPESAAVDAASLAAEPDHWEAGDVDWLPIVPPTQLAGHSANRFRVEDDRPWTHVRFSIHPDGGVARLRVHGEAAPDWESMAREAPEGRVEVAAIPRGGMVVACSDEFFGGPGNLLLPGESEGVWDGWETRRRRGPGCDWVVVRLGRRVKVDRIEIDTRHYKGNYPASARVEAVDATGADPEALLAEEALWKEVVSETSLRPDVAHVFEPPELTPAAATHVRLSIHPDGGVARLRVLGTPLA